MNASTKRVSSFSHSVFLFFVLNVAKVHKQGRYCDCFLNFCATVIYTRRMCAV